MGGRLFPQRARGQLVPVLEGVRSRAAETIEIGRLKREVTKVTVPRFLEKKSAVCVR